MAFIPVPGTVQATLVFALPEARIATVNPHFSVGGVPSPMDMEELAIWLEAQWRNDGSQYFSDAMGLTAIDVRDLSNQQAPVVNRIVTPFAPGQVPSPCLPANVAFVTTLRTGFRGRSARGRLFWAGLAESAVTGNTVATLVAQGIARWVGEWMTPPFPWDFVVVSRYSNGNPRVTGQTLPVTSVEARNSRVDTQRRRLGRG